MNEEKLMMKWKNQAQTLIFEAQQKETEAALARREATVLLNCASELEDATRARK